MTTTTEHTRRQIIHKERRMKRATEPKPRREKLPYTPELEAEYRTAQMSSSKVAIQSVERDIAEAKAGTSWFERHPKYGLINVGYL